MRRMLDGVMQAGGGASRVREPRVSPGNDGAPRDTAFEALLEFLHQTQGFDFTVYKRATLMRRVQRRLDDIGVTTFADYTDYLQVHPEEFAALFDTILINVTNFFRDPDSWTFLRDEVLHPLAGRQPDQPIRIWCAGCASGEEPYSIAILLAEELGATAFRDRVKIYATDVDEDALARARTGTYSEKELEKVPEELRDRYFERHGTHRVFTVELRRCVIFGRHDLSRDAPISHVDVLVCRNVLMYFTAETQRRILEQYYYALRDDGALFMGRAEMLLSHSNLFAPLDAHHRVFRKVASPRLEPLHVPVEPSQLASLAARAAAVRDLAVDAAPVAQVAVDADSRLVVANRAARALFDLKERDLGRPLQDLELSYRPLELRSRIERAQSTRLPVVEHNVERAAAEGVVQHFDITVMPLPVAADGRSPGTSIVFADVTEYARVQSTLATSKLELETAYEELQSTNEELETTNEELQSTVEELETTNEEFQSANEELETMNEELQSINGELQTVNYELHQRTFELKQITEFTETVFSSLHLGLVVLDPEGAVRVWNAASEDLWGLRSDEVRGEQLSDLDIGLPVHDLLPLVEGARSDRARAEIHLRATNRRGRPVLCRAVVSPLDGAASGSASGVIILLEPSEDGDGVGPKRGRPTPTPSAPPRAAG